MRIVGIGAAAIAVALAACLPAHATTYTVDSTADAVDQTPGDDVCATAAAACTLRAAVQEANAHAGADVVALPAGLFILGHVGASEDLAATGDLDVTEALEVHGAGKDASIVDGFMADRIFHVLGVAFTVRDLTLRHGNAGAAPGGAIFHAAPGATLIERVAFTLNTAAVAAGVLHADGALTIADADFDTNVASGTAAAVLASGSGAVSVTNSTFTDNSAGPAGAGGALLLGNTGVTTIQGCAFSGNLAGTAATLLSTGGALTVADSTFEQNTAINVAGGPLYSGPGNVTFTNVKSLGNVSPVAAGGYVQTSAGLQLSGSEFSDNFALTQYAGLYFQAMADVVIQNTAFRRNGSLGPAGGLIGVTSAAMSLTDVEAAENSAAVGGGLYVAASGALSLTRVRAINNGAGAGIGGGIYAQAGMNATLTDSTVDGNIAGQVGGIYLIAGGASAVAGSTISNNRAAGSGVVGGAYFSAANASTVTNTTFSGNVADMQVGGLYSSGDFTYRNVTFANNDAPMGSAITNVGGTLTLTSSIVAGPAPSHCAGVPVTSLGYNIDSTTTCGLAGPGDQSNTDPQLGPLQDNGGPTFTQLAGTGSPALDKGNPTGCPATDQRGQTRPTDADGDGTAACDVGATEFFDLCPNDPNKIQPGVCGCGIPEPGLCGCGVPDTDVALANGVPDCFVNGEFKARLAHGKDMVGALTGDASDDAMAQELVDMSGGLDDYMTAHADLQLTSTKPKPSKLVKKIQKTVKKVVKAKTGKKLDKAKTKAVKAFDALDAMVAPQA